MGIKNLSRFVRDNYPELCSTLSTSKLRGKKIAVDTAIYMNKFKAACGDRWLGSFISMVCMFIKDGVHPVFVFDNGHPPEKNDEREKRAQSRRNQRDRIARLEEAIEDFDRTGIVSDMLRAVHDKESAGVSTTTLLRRPGSSNFNIDIVRQKLRRMKSHIFHITDDDYDTLKKFFHLAGVPWLFAADEAEKTCVHLLRENLVHAVLSEDSDCLAYQCENFLSKLDFRSKTVRRVRYSDLVEAMHFSDDTFLDFCIMAGTDYNSNIRGIGVSKAFDLMSKHASIENLPKNLDTSSLRHRVCKRLFTTFPPLTAKQRKSVRWLPLKPRPGLEEFPTIHNLQDQFQRMMQAYKPRDITFE